MSFCVQLPFSGLEKTPLLSHSLFCPSVLSHPRPFNTLCVHENYDIILCAFLFVYIVTVVMQFVYHFRFSFSTTFFPFCEFSLILSLSLPSFRRYILWYIELALVFCWHNAILLFCLHPLLIIC